MRLDLPRDSSEIDRLLVESVEELAAEQGEPVEQVRLDLAEMAATVDHIIRRVLIVAVRRSPVLPSP